MMNLSEKQIYRFENVEVDLSRGCILRNGKERHLRQKAFQVLVYLLKNHKRLVSKEELFEKIWTETAVTDDVLVQCVKDIRRAIGDSSHQSHFIKTVPKSGYRFIGTITEDLIGSYIEQATRIEIEYEEEVDTDQPNTLSQQINRQSKSNNNYKIYLLAVVLLLICVISGIYYVNRRFSFASEQVLLPKIEGKKTIAVMFFENQSKSAELDWLREGLTDMLITDLSRSENLTVLSRIQLHSLIERKNLGNNKISLEQAKEIANQTQAEYFMTGSFVKIGERIRLDVSLYDSNSANLQATETLTVEKPEQILTEIDLLSLKISHRLNPGTNEKQTLASVMTDNLEAYRYYSLAVEKSQVLLNKEAIELLEKAITLDPRFAMAHARIGYVYSLSIGESEKGKPYLEKAFKLSERLTEKDRLNIKAWYEIANLDFTNAIQTYREIISKYPLEIESYWRLGNVLQGEERSSEAIEVLKQGLTIDPQNEVIYNYLGGIYSKLGNHAEAIIAHQRYVSLAPNEANAYDSLGLSYQWSGDYEKAMENFHYALKINPNFEIAIIHLANTHFQMGQYRAAENLYRRYIEIAPSVNERNRGWNCIAIVFFKKHDFAAAEKSLKEFFKFGQEDFGLSYFIALEKGDLKPAEQIEKTMLLKTKNNERGKRLNQRFILFPRGYIALKKGQNEEAIKYFQETIRFSPPSWNIENYEDCLANAYLQLGKTDEAISEYKRILQLNPNYPLVYFHLAQAFQAKGEIDQAKDYYRKFLEVWKYADTDIPEIITAQKYVSN